MWWDGVRSYLLCRARTRVRWMRNSGAKFKKVLKNLVIEIYNHLIFLKIDLINCLHDSHRKEPNPAFHGYLWQDYVNKIMYPVLRLFKTYDLIFKKSTLMVEDDLVVAINKYWKTRILIIFFWSQISCFPQGNDHA